MLCAAISSPQFSRLVVSVALQRGDALHAPTAVGSWPRARAGIQQLCSRRCFHLALSVCLCRLQSSKATFWKGISITITAGLAYVIFSPAFNLVSVACPTAVDCICSLVLLVSHILLSHLLWMLADAP